MGKYDVIDKQYFGDMSRMADLISACLFRNKIRICGEELEKLDGRYPSFKTASGEDARDILCLCEKQRVKYGLEIESHADYSMPKRMLVYDAEEYEKEHREFCKRNKQEKRLRNFVEHKSGLKEEDELYSVFNIVFYLGQGRYKGKRSLRDLCKKIPEEYAPYLAEKQQDYNFTLLEVDYCNPEVFSSDLKQFVMAMQARNDKEKMKKLFEQVDFQEASRDLQNMIAVHLGEKEIARKVLEDGEPMCKAMRDWKKELLSEGREEGREEGRKEMALANIKSVMETLHISAERAMEALCFNQAEQDIYIKYF